MPKYNDTQVVSEVRVVKYVCEYFIILNES
jgi:hypothetical protein